MCQWLRFNRVMAQLALNKHSAMLLGCSFLLDTTLRLKGGATVCMYACVCVAWSHNSLKYTYIRHGLRLSWTCFSLCLMSDGRFLQVSHIWCGTKSSLIHQEQPHLKRDSGQSPYAGICLHLLRSFSQMHQDKWSLLREGIPAHKKADEWEDQGRRMVEEEEGAETRGEMLKQYSGFFYFFFSSLI